MNLLKENVKYTEGLLPAFSKAGTGAPGYEELAALLIL